LAPDYLGFTPFITAGAAQTRSSGTAEMPNVRTMGFAYGRGLQRTVLTRLQLRLEWQDLNAAAPTSVHPAMVAFSAGTRF
jgi:hypothetical protein